MEAPSAHGSLTSFAVGVGVGFGIGLFAVTHPVVGILAQPILAAKRIYHHNKALEHYSHIPANKDGTTLRSKKISEFSNTKFTEADLPVLEHLSKALTHEKKYCLTVNMIKTLAKCIIPIFGLIWAMKTFESQEHREAIGNLNQYIYEVDKKINSLKDRNITDRTNIT
jgi:hypothetical protein